MNTEILKDCLGFVAMTAFAIKWAFDWKTDGWWGHAFTVSSAIIAAVYLAVIMIGAARA